MSWICNSDLKFHENAEIYWQEEFENLHMKEYTANKWTAFKN